MLLIILAPFTLLEFSPLVANSSSSSADYANASKAAKRLNAKLKNNSPTLTMSINHVETNALAAIAQDQIPHLNTNLLLKAGVVKGSFSYPILNDWLWLNIETEIAEGSEIKLHALKVGKIAIHQKLANEVSKYFLKELSGYDLESLNRIVNSVTISANEINISAKKPENVNIKIGTLVKKLNGARWAGLDSYSEGIDYYQRLFYTASKSNAAAKTEHSLAFYLSELVAHVPPNDFHIPGDQHASAALLSLALLVDSGYLQAILTNTHKEQYKDIPIKLHGRFDLAKHFILSASIKILSDQSTSISIGEAKELIDAGAGGSGFSFRDIAADRAGLHFAELILNKQNWEQQLKPMLPLNEADFFPNVKDFQEGLSEADFETHYQSTDSVVYKKIINRIDARIMSSPIFTH